MGWLMTLRVRLTFDRRFATPNSWFWIAAVETIRCRIKVASADEVSPVDVHLRYRGKNPAPGLVHCHPISEDIFLCEGAVLHPDLPYRIELILTGTPEAVAADLRSL